MSLQSAQGDEARQWLSEAKAALHRWGRYYRAGFSALYPRGSLLGSIYSGNIQQPVNAMRVEYANENDATDKIVSGLPSVMRRGLIEIYGMQFTYRNAADRAGMNLRAFRDMIQMAEGGVATGLALLDELEAVRTESVATTRDI